MREPREITPHIETGATELLAREALHSFYTYITVIQLSGEKYFVQVRAIVNSHSLFRFLTYNCK
jgi:hypothetical protein